MSNWNDKRVEERLNSAAKTLKRLPEERVQGYFTHPTGCDRNPADGAGIPPRPAIA